MSKETEMIRPKYYVDRRIDLALSYEDFKKRKEIYLKRLERVEEDIKSGRAK